MFQNLYRKIGLMLYILTCLFSTESRGQSDTVFFKYNEDPEGEVPVYTVDTIVFDTPNARQILFKTMVLPNTLHQEIAKNYGLYLQNVTLSPCSNGELGEVKMKSQVVSVLTSEKDWKIEIKHIGNCCHEFLCDVEIIDKETVNLVALGYGATYCFCDCCFGLVYEFETMAMPELDSLKYVMINGDLQAKTLIKKQ